LSNTEELILARKDFELNAYNAHKTERDVLEEIVRNSTTHKNIMKSLGSLQIGSTYSLFMPLADCDLYQYMMRNPQPPRDWAQKARLLQSAIGLTSAIVHLHTQLESVNYERLSCFHMDLKPQNILVVTNAIPEEQWKLSDFNMSCVKTRKRLTDDQSGPRHGHTFDGFHDVNKLFNRRTPDVMDPSLTEPIISRRGTGTYLAPEACVDGSSVTAESDIWSLGCVISVIFTYMYGGAKGVEEFTDLRAGQGLDRFFAFSNTKEPRRLRDAILSEAVRKWFKELRRRTMEHSSDEGLIYEEMIRFLENDVLLVDPKKRQATKAEDARKKLIVAFTAYGNLSNGLGFPKGKSKTLMDRATRVLHIRKRSQPKVQAHAPDWAISLPYPVKAFEFGPKAEILACVTDSSIYAYSLDHVCLTRDFNDLIACGSKSPEAEGRTWSSAIGVSQQYIVAATDHDEFEVSYTTDY
jgi:serine/threonine protein kinase